jgi:hypothetical protein
MAFPPCRKISAPHSEAIGSSDTTIPPREILGRNREWSWANFKSVYPSTSFRWFFGASLSSLIFDVIVEHAGRDPKKIAISSKFLQGVIFFEKPEKIMT